MEGPNNPFAQFFQEFVDELGEKAHQVFCKEEADIITKHLFPEKYWPELIEKKQGWKIVGISHSQFKTKVTVEKDGLKNRFVFEEKCQK